MSRAVCKVFSIALMLGLASLSACTAIPTSGPSSSQIGGAGGEDARAGIQVVDLTEDVARRLLADRRSTSFAAALGNDVSFQRQLGVGDTIDVSIWEAPPATLFGAAQSLDGKSAAVAGNARATVLADLTIDGDGSIDVPFIGRVKAAGRTPPQLQRDIAGGLRNIAHDPQVLVRLSRNVSSYATVVGDVANSTRMPLSPRGERVLDAIAAAGGVRQPIGKITVQVTRGDIVAKTPLDTMIRDPRQNVPLRAGDVVAALFQPNSFMVLGATGKNEEINFEGQGITLSQALARAGGLQDSRSDAQGVFIFRFEDAGALSWQKTPARVTADGKVPVIYRVNLRDPGTLFTAQSFMMENKDLLYVSNAPMAELQKVLNVIFSVAYPIVNSVNAFK